jgi:hypothetical protein
MVENIEEAATRIFLLTRNQNRIRKYSAHNPPCTRTTKLGNKTKQTKQKNAKEKKETNTGDERNNKDSKSV